VWLHWKGKHLSTSFQGKNRKTCVFYVWLYFLQWKTEHFIFYFNFLHLKLCSSIFHSKKLQLNMPNLNFLRHLISQHSLGPQLNGQLVNVSAAVKNEVSITLRPKHNCFHHEKQRIWKLYIFSNQAWYLFFSWQKQQLFHVCRICL
jgi:hypothetical protein